MISSVQAGPERVPAGLSIEITNVEINNAETQQTQQSLFFRLLRYVSYV